MPPPKPSMRPTIKAAPSGAQQAEDARRAAQKKRDAKKMKKVVKLAKKKMKMQKNLAWTLACGSAEEKYAAVSAILDELPGVVSDADDDDDTDD